MGRIRTDMVKRTTGKITSSYPEKFSKKFDKNKEGLKEVAEIRSKKLRNLIAGYAVRLKIQEEKKAKGGVRRSASIDSSRDRGSRDGRGRSERFSREKNY